MEQEQSSLSSFRNLSILHLSLWLAMDRRMRHRARARHCRAWRIASFNCQHVDLGHTVDDVLRHFPDHQVVALQATGEHLRAQLPLGESHTLRRTAWGWVCHIPWSAGAFANQSCGLALAFSHRAVRRGGIQMIKLPSPELGISGRAAAIRVRRRQEYDFCIFSLCWPTGVRQNESGFMSLASWIGTVLQDLPGRCLPILCGDFNAKFTYDASRGSVGPCGEQVASPSWLSRIWLDVADRFQLVAANTFAPAGLDLHDLAGLDRHHQESIFSGSQQICCTKLATALCGSEPGSPYSGDHLSRYMIMHQ